MATNLITIELWTPSNPEVTVEAYATDGNGIQTGGEGRTEVVERTVNNSLVIEGQPSDSSGNPQEPFILRVVSIVPQSVFGNLDEIRVSQGAGEQANFRYNSFVSQNDLGMNRTGTGSTQAWGTSVRQRFEAPCVIEFGQEWYRLAGSLGKDAQDGYELDLTVYEVP